MIKRYHDGFCQGIIDIFNSLLLLSLTLALSIKLPIGILLRRIVYLSVVYLQVPATLTAKVTN